jgi:DNA-binding transcriptional MerR regulator
VTPDSHHSIGEVLALLQEEFPDVTISKIRFLEKEGLIDPERTPSGYRKFYDGDVACLRWILRQQRENYLPLKVIRQRIEAGDWSLDDNGAASEPTANAVARPPIEDEEPRGPVAVDPGMTGASFTVDELSAAAGLAVDILDELTRYGLLEGRTVGSAMLYDEEALVVAKLAASFGRHGVEARHLRMYKLAADREAGLLEQLATPLIRQRDPVARREAFELVGELCSLGDRLRSSLLRRSLRDQLGPS